MKTNTKKWITKITAIVIYQFITTIMVSNLFDIEVIKAAAITALIPLVYIARALAKASLDGNLTADEIDEAINNAEKLG